MTTGTATPAVGPQPASPPSPARSRRPGARALVTLVVAIVALILPFGLSAFQLSTAVFILIAAIGALGLNVLTGYTGQISLGHAFFLGVGAYTAGKLGGDHGLTAAIWIPAAGVVAGLCGAIVGPTALRLRGLYLAIVTIALVFIGQHIFVNVNSLSGGPAGRAFPPVKFGGFDFSPGQQLKLGGLVIDHNGLYYYLSLFLLALGMLYVWNLARTRQGRAMQAVRERELAASVMGVNLARTKVVAFVISSFMAGVSGALYASYLSYAQPDQWSLLLSIQYVAAIIVGGIGTIWGPLLGSIVIFALPSILQNLPGLAQGGTSGVPVADVTNMVYGALIVVFFVLEPNGIVGLGARIARLWGRLRSGPRGPSSDRGEGRELDQAVPTRRETTWAK